MKNVTYTFEGTEVHSKDFTKKFFFHSSRGEVYQCRDAHGWKEADKERMVDVTVSTSYAFEVIEETRFGGKVNYKSLPVTKEVEVDEDDENEEGEDE